MNEKDKPEFLNSFMTMAEMFGQEPTDATIDAWWTIFKKYTLEQFQAGVTTALATLKNYGRLPMPADLIEIITGGPGNLADRAEVEASKVLQAVKHEGAYKSIQFDDAVTAAVIQQGFGGWIKLCEDLRSDSEKWFRKDFFQMYGAYARQGITHNGHLAGLIEADNTTRGYTDNAPEPIQIGDTKEVKRIQNENKGLTN